MAVSAPTDKRFRRAHVSPARRRRRLSVSRRHLVYAVMATAALAFGIQRTATYMLSSDALVVSRITVTGNVRMLHGEVVSLLDGLQGRNMLLLDLDGWRSQLHASPWVADAALRRVFPGTVAVFISERQPIGIGRLGEALYLIDEQGEVIDEFGPSHAELDLPVIDGLGSLGVDPRLGGEAVDEGRAVLATRLLSSLHSRPDLAGRVSQVDVSDIRDAVVILKDDTTLIRVGDDQFAERLQSYIDLAPALRERVPRIDYVDLRFGERVYVRPQGSASQKPSNGG
jgi:cell division protein FtsQ